MADEQKTTTPDRATYTSLNLGRESVDRHPSQQPETLYSSPAQRAALLRTCGGAAILLGIVISLVASAAMVATAPPPVGTVRFGLPQPQAKRSVAGRLRQRLVVDVGTDNFGVVARRYGGAAPAPTLLVEPGDTLTVVVDNKLGPEAPGDSLMTGLHRPNTTSLHVHGWHVSPREDDVFTLIAPGSSKTYVYHLPQTHPAGTFWYHAHGHGSSSLQAGWMAGALVVHDKDHRRLPPDVVLLMTQVRSRVFMCCGDGVTLSKHTTRAATRRLAARRWRRRGTHTTPSRRWCRRGARPTPARRRATNKKHTGQPRRGQGAQLRLGVLRVRLEASSCKGKGGERGVDGRHGLSIGEAAPGALERELLRG